MLSADGTAGLPPASRHAARTDPAARAGAVRHVLMTADAVGGVWRYSIDLGRALAARGVRTTLAVMGPPPGAAQRLEAEEAGLALVDRPYRLEWMDEPWTDVARAGAWLLALERSLAPDVVHLNGYAHAALAWRAPVVVVAHSCVRTWWRAVKREAAPGRLDAYRAAVAAGLAAARVVVAPTRAMLEALQAEYEVTLGARVIPNGSAADVAGAVPDRKEPFVLAAGRAWDEGKNIGALCAAAGRLAWPVYVAGDVREPGGAAARECRLNGVRPLGRLTAAEMRAWYGRAAIYALPARYEPFGLSVLEAAQARCALVLGDIPSLRETWADAALFVPPDSEEALVAALEWLAGDEAARAAWGARAAARAAGFGLGRTADAYLHLYEELTA